MVAEDTSLLPGGVPPRKLETTKVGTKYTGTWENRNHLVDETVETEDEKLRRLFDETDLNGGGTL